MSLDFKFPITVTNNKKVLCGEFYNKHFIDLQKYIEHDDDQLLGNHFDKLCHYLFQTEENLHAIDKFILLLKLRAQYIDPVLSFSSQGGNKQAIHINLIVENVLEGYKPTVVKQDIGGMLFTLGTPTKLTKRNSVLDYINKIKLEDEEILLGNIDLDEKEKILQNIPYKYIPLLKNAVKTIKQSPIVLFQLFEDGELKDNMFGFTSYEMFTFLKLCFSEGYEGLFYYVYIFTTKLNTSYTDFQKYTPIETKKIIKHFSKEMEEKNKSNQNLNIGGQ